MYRSNKSVRPCLKEFTFTIFFDDDGFHKRYKNFNKDHWTFSRHSDMKDIASNNFQHENNLHTVV